MNFTGVLGTSASVPGNLVLGITGGATDIQDALVFFESLQVNHVFARSLDDTLTFTDSIIESTHNFYSRSLTDTLTFVDNISPVTIHHTQDTLSFSESFQTNHAFAKSIVNALAFSESLIVGHATSRSVADTLTFVDSASIFSPIIPASADDILTFAETLTQRKVHTEVLHDTLTFIPTAQPLRITSYTFRDHLDFIDTPTRNVSYNLTLADTLDFSQPLLRSLNYNTIIAVPNPLGIVIRNTIPNVLFTGHGYAVTLKPPVWDDSETGVNAVSIKRAMDKSSRSYVKSSHRVHLKYSFNVSRQQAYALQEFIYRTSGQSVTLYNWKYEMYHGYITTNPLVITQQRSYANLIDVEFDGIRLI